MNKLRYCMMLLLVLTSVLVGVCQVPRAGFSAHATSLNFYFNDDPSVYAYTGQTRAVSATVQISIVVDGTFIPGVHTHPSRTVSISGPDPNNPQQTTTVGSATFTHPGPYTNANVSVTLPAAAGAYTYTASLTGGEGTASPVSDSATIIELVSLTPDQGTVFDDGSGNPNIVAYAIPIAASGSITVTAVANPSVAEADLPSSWSLTGGSGAGKYTRTVSKSVSAITVISCTCGSTTKTVKIYAYTASITSMPALCAGGKNDAAHKDTISVRAQAGGVGIPNASVELMFASPVSSLETDLKPSFGTSTLTTDANGNASTTLMSGIAVLPSAAGLTCATANVRAKLDGYEVPSSDTALSITSPTMTVDAYDPCTAEPVTELYLYGDWCDLVGEATFTQGSTTYNVTTSHNLTWRFKFWASVEAPTDPENDVTYDFDGTVSNGDAEFPWLTQYGYIDYDLTIDGQRTAIYITGTTPGWIWWYMDDADVLIEQ